MGPDHRPAVRLGSPHIAATMRFDLVIFDCDGVLIDSELLSVRAALECLAEYGLYLSAKEVLERYTGISMAGMLADLETRFGRTLPDFRRPLYRVLERGESVHALQRQICTQPLPAKRGRRTEELIATSGALTLLTNCVMAWNTQRLQRAVERESQRTAPRYSIDALRSIGPVGHRHINFRGTYRFPVERYADRLVASAA